MMCTIYEQNVPGIETQPSETADENKLVELSRLRREKRQTQNEAAGSATAILFSKN